MAAQKSPNLFKVNLLIYRGEHEKFYSKLIKWGLSSGRFIVIFVEMITISAFIFRYKLDADLNDLQEQINDKIPYIKSLGTDEMLIKHTQFQLSTISKLKAENIDFISPLADLTAIVPKSIKITNITFDRTGGYPKTSMSINGQTPSNLELSVFIKELQKKPSFSDITLTNISFDTQTIFTITGNLVTKSGGTN